MAISYDEKQKKVQAALEARKQRAGAPAAVPSQAQQTQSKEDKINAALAARSQRMQATMPRVLSDLQTLYNSEIDTYKGTGVKYGAYDEVNSSQSASRKNIAELRQKVNAYRSYLEDGAADKILSSLDQMEQGYDAYLFMSSFDSEDSYQSAVRQLGYQKKYEGRSYNEIQTMLADMQEGEEKEWLSEHADDYMTLDEAREKKDSATGSEQLYYNDIFNKKLISQNTEILANTMMEGTSGSVLDEMKAIAEMENSTEKKQRKAAVISKMEELGIAVEDYGIYSGDSNVTWDLFWKWAGKKAGSGLASVGKAITGTADLLVGKPLQSLGWENNPISQTANYYKNDYDTWKYSADLMAAKMGGGTGFEYGGQVIEGTVAAIPDALLAIMTAGTSAAGSLSTKAAYESGNILTKAGLTAQSMAKNPQFWMSYGRTLSSDYEEAKALGASDNAAALGATISSLINAGIEIGFDGGSGIQGLPNDLADQGVRGILAWVESSLEEGGEELLQGFVNNAVSKVLYDSETELLNPKEMAMDFAMGAAVGGILGGGQMAVSKGVNSAVDSWENVVQNRRNKKNYGSSPENIQALILEGLESAEGSTSKILAEKYQEKLNSGKSLTGAEISKLIDANEQEFRLESIASIQAAAEEKLTELGETGDVAEIARVIAKKAAGETLTRSDTTVLRSSEYGAVMAKNIHANKSGRIDADEYIQTLQATQLPQVNAEAQNTAEAPQELAADASRATVRENRTVEQREDVSEATGKNSLQVAADGVTRQISTGKAVEPKKIVSIRGNETVIETMDGEKISSEDIEFGSENTDMLWRYITNFYGITPNSANGIISAYDGGMSVGAFMKGAGQEFRNGFHNLKSGSGEAQKLNAFQRNIIYNLGQKAAGEQVAKETAAVSRKGKSGKRQGKVYFDEGAQRVTDFRAYAKEKGLKLSAVQETAVSTMEKFSAVLGVDFYVYASYEKDGKRYYIDQNGEEKTAPSGKYYSDGRIYIDLYAGETGKGTMLFTVAHELTHFIRQWSPAKFKVLANFLVKVYGSKGVSVNTLVEEQIAKAKRNGRELSWEEAYEEMVADSMEAMLTDGNAVQILAELKQEDKTLWQKVCDWFKNLAEDLKELVSAYKGYKPDSNEGKMVAEMQDVISVLESLYAEALADAGENFQAASEEQKNTTQEGGVKMQTRSVNGDKVVWIENSGFTNAQLKDPNAIAQYIAAHIGEVYKIIESGQRVYIGKNLPREYTHSKYTSYLQKKNPSALKAKNKAASALGEMIEIATNRRWEATKHKQSKDAKYGMYRYDTKFAFPVKDQRGNVTTVKAYDAELLIRNASDGKKYLYDIVNIKEDTANALDLRHKEARKGNYQAATQNDVSKNSIRNPEADVKEKFSLRDADYMDAVNNGDMETAQKMVEEAARNAGYTSLFYHGSKKGGGFTKFRDWSYFTESRRYAERYAERENKGSLYQTFVKLEMPFDTRNADAGALFEQIRGEYGLSEIQDTGLPDWTDGYDIADYIDENDMDYDGIILDEGGDIVDGKPVSRGLSYVVRKSAQIKSADPVTYDDNGSVIPLTERFNEENEDIRYSLRDPAAAKANKVLERENVKLKADVSQLKELLKLQRQVTGGTVFTKSSIEKAARILMKENSAKGSAEELAGHLDALYAYIAKNEEVSWEGIREAAEPAVTWLREHTAVQRDAYATEILKELKGSRFYLDESQKQEAAHSFGSYNDFRHQLTGVATATDKGNMSLDSLWHELSGKYPSIFDPSTSSGDMPRAFAEAVDKLRSMQDGGKSYDVQLAEQDLLRQVYDSYWRVPTLRTVADVKQREINALKSRHYERMNALKEYHKEQIELLEREHREDIRWVRNAMQEKAEKQLQALSDKYRESKERSAERRSEAELRRKIKAFKGRLESSLLRPTDRQYVPVGLVKAMADVCGLIDTDTELIKSDGSINKAQEARNLTKEKLQDLCNEYEKIRNLAKSDPVYSGEFDEMISTYLAELRESYSGKSLRDMKLDELSEMYEILRAIEETLQDARRLIGWGEADDVYEASDSIITEQNEITKSRKHGVRGKAQKARDDSLLLSMAPVRNVERMSGYHEDSYLLNLFKRFEQGIRKKNKFTMDAYRGFENLTSGKAYDDAIYNEVGDKRYEDVNGREFGLSKMQMMQAILSYERESANGMKHIEKSGFSFADLDMLRKGKLRDAISEEYSHRVPAAVEMVAEFAEMLKNDKWCQDYMEAARKFFNGMAKNAINETTIALKHRIIAKDKNYIPFEVDKNFIVREISAEHDIQQTINSYGMLKDITKGASQPLIITGLNNVLDRHIEQVGNVYGLAIEVRNFNKVWNAKSLDSASNDLTVKGIMQRNWGIEGVKLIEQAVQDIQGPRHNDQSELYKKIKSGYIGATFLLNLSVVTKQIGSLFSATSMLRWRSPVRMIGNLLYTMVQHKKIAAEVDKYTATSWMRRQGLSDAEVHTFMTEGRKSFVGKLVGKLPAALNPGKWITAMDSAVALSLWKYAKADTAKRTGLKGEELFRATAEFYDEVIENTQSMTDVLHRPEIQKRSDIISESFGMFKTDLYQMAGQLHATAGRYAANKTKENGKALVRTVYAIAMSAIWGQLMSTLFALLRYKVDQYRDEEDEDLTTESWLKRQGFSLAGDLLGYIFPIFGSEIVGFFENVMYGESDEIVDSLAMTAINDLYDAAITIGASIKEGEMPKPADMKKLAIRALQVFGIPANNILRTVGAIDLHAKDIANGEFLSFEAGADRSSKHHIHRIAEAMDKGNKEVAKGLYEEAIEEIALERSKDGSVGEDELKEAKSSLQSALGTKYKDGEITKGLAKRLLSGLFEKNDDEIFWIFDKWDYASKEGSTEDYSKYASFYAAVQTGKNLKNVIKTYTDNGVECKTLASQITSYFKPIYTEMSEKERKGLKGYLVNAFVLCGDERKVAEEKIAKWEFAADHPELEDKISYTQYQRWETDGKPHGVSVELFTNVFEYRDNGSETRSQEEVAKYINSLQISTEQKDALWCCFWKQSTLKNAPWH